MLRRHVFYAVMLSVQGLLGPAGVLALQVQGTVFVDANGNGQRDADEQGLQGVMVSDGVTVVDTGADGAYTIEAAGAPALVWVSLPRDYQVVGRFWHWTDGSKPADFALAASSQPDEFNLVQITDAHVGRGDVVQQFCQRLNSFPVPLAFVVNTGDLVGGVDVVQPEEAPRQYVAYMDAVKPLKLPLFNLPGNHEHVGFNHPTADRAHPFFGKGLYPLMLGPMHYSWDWGPVHFVGLDGTRISYREALGDEQLTWLAEDLKRQPAEKPIVLFCHQSLLQVKDRPAMIEVLKGRRVLGGFCGHLHATWEKNQDGFTVYHTGALSGSWWSGPNPDGSPQGFRLIRLAKEGLETAFFGREGPWSISVLKPSTSDVQKGVVPVEAIVLDFGEDVVLTATLAGEPVPLRRGARAALWSTWTGKLDTTVVPDQLAELVFKASGQGQESTMSTRFIIDNGKRTAATVREDAVLRLQVRGVEQANIVRFNGEQLGTMSPVPNDTWIEFTVPAALLQNLNVLTIEAVAPEGGTNKDDFSVGPVRLEVAGKTYYDPRQASFTRYSVGDNDPASYADKLELYFCLP